MSLPQPATSGAVTIVTQTRVRAGREEEFAKWQRQIGTATSEFPGFIEQTLMPPNPPAQIDWVILQRFASVEAATSWLHSQERLALIEYAQPMVVGQVDIHVLKDNAAGVLPSPVSAVIATRLKPGAEAEYQAWERKVAAAQSSAKGFQGYRFEPPIPGVQESWLAIVRFDSEANLQAWMNSPGRLALLKEAEAFTEEFHARIVRTGFDQWFKVADGTEKPATWKMNMLVLMNLYPVVFVFTTLIGTPLLTNKGVPFWLALFIGNIVSVNLLNWLVPRSASYLGWWLAPKGPSRARINVIGVSIVVGIYAMLLLAFAWYSSSSLPPQ
jgi:uncharacterized protein